MRFAQDIDAAVARLERAGGLDLATGAVTPELVKRCHRRAQQLRAEAQRRVMNRIFTALLRVPAAALRRNLDDAFKRRLRLQAEPTVSTIG
jgi:hypothetical protein